MEGVPLCVTVTALIGRSWPFRSNISARLKLVHGDAETDKSGKRTLSRGWAGGGCQGGWPLHAVCVFGSRQLSRKALA